MEKLMLKGIKVRDTALKHYRSSRNREKKERKDGERELSFLFHF